jgi:CheY-like chemotaxis protein
VKKNIPAEPESKVRVLIVEDEAIIANDMERMLETIGCDAVTASSGEESVRKAKHLHPDVVFMDIRLKGGMDGVEAARQITDTFNIPIIYVTAFSEEVVADPRGLSSGYPRVTKPFEEREIECVIKKLIPGNNN